jgi:hypothetical protein
MLNLNLVTCLHLACEFAVLIALVLLDDEQHLHKARIKLNSCEMDYCVKLCLDNIWTSLPENFRNSSVTTMAAKIPPSSPL